MKAGWKTVKLEEVCAVEFGERVVRKKDAGTMYPVYGGGGATFNIDRHNRESCVVISRFGMSERCVRFVEGKFFLNDSGLTVTSTSPEASQGYIDLLLHAKAQEIYALGSGTAQKNLDTKSFRSLEIPLPPLAEQKRIVALLDEAFAGIDAAKTKAELNLSSSKTILGLHLKSIFSQGGGSPRESWHKTKLANLTDVQSGSAFPTERQGKVSSGIPFYKVSDMNISGNERYMIHENNSVTEDVRRTLNASIFPKGSVIFPKVGGAIATNKKRITTRECCVDNNVMGAIPKPGKMTSEFLYYFFLAYNLSEFANEAHLPSIKKTTVEEWELSVPRDIKDQECIVDKLDILTDSIHKLTQITEQKIAAFAELKSSILAQAFAGELTA